MGRARRKSSAANEIAVTAPEMAVLAEVLRELRSKEEEWTPAKERELRILLRATEGEVPKYYPFFTP